MACAFLAWILLAIFVYSKTYSR
jgi:hypothetical protein